MVADPAVRPRSTWTTTLLLPLVRAMVELADTLTQDYDLQEFLSRLLGHCTRLFNAPAAGIMLRNPRGGFELVSSSSQAAEQVELFQLQAETGPCLECVVSGESVQSVDLRDDPDRWPGWSQVALGSGYRSVYATPMRLRDQTIGAFNLFGTEPAALTVEDLELIRGLADTATIGILHQRSVLRSETLSSQLQTALDSRIVIEQAKGLIAGRPDFQGSIDQAFGLLRDYSRRTNTKLGAVCAEVVAGRVGLSELGDR